MGAACGLSGVTLVDARRADDREPAQHVPRGGAEGGHREAAHDARFRAREPAILALEARDAKFIGGKSRPAPGKPRASRTNLNSSAELKVPPLSLIQDHTTDRFHGRYSVCESASRYLERVTLA